MKQVQDVLKSEIKNDSIDTRYSHPKRAGIPPSPPPPPPPPEGIGCGEFISIREEMPIFSGCEEIEEYSERRKCGEEKMLNFIYTNLRYPCSNFCGEGTVIVSFIVEKDGCITNAKVIRDIGGGMGEEALRIVRLMPDWEPATQRGRKVRVQYNLPIRFRLDDP